MSFILNVPEIYRYIEYDKVLENRFLDRLNCLGLKNHLLQQVGFELLRLTGNWFYKCPGTNEQSIGYKHHNYDGGLVSHLLGVEELCCDISTHQEGINKEILSFAALFHDWAKCFEFLNYRHLGHVAISLMIIPQMLYDYKIDQKTICEISHLFVSHHGSTSEGALVTPQSKEAYILAYADRLNMKLDLS